MLTLSGTATVTASLALTGTGAITFTAKAGTTGLLARTGTGTLTLLVAPGLRGTLALTGGSLLELSGVKDAELTHIPFLRVLLPMTTQRYLTPLTKQRTLGNIWEPPRTLEHIHEQPSLNGVTVPATLSLIS